ncbi:RNA deprotection pyrophosphohydrolase [Aquibacillus salsiterrae]|uniref:Nucleoside triphosphatase YtkD n=1 Tax=Aquibacillus salsiterrae TaxID=2950439 RepID=A0A9X3WH22_9BACI|nr:nucleoside triphosphatase YtkD [Aquibacillus salsiterrae]MDC3418275.1 nucleoside triphosphatase YtkD [Aquibacillus salsiterrae]
MKIFKDYYNNEVKLSFEDHPFTNDPKHVWVICVHKGKWLLTKHRDRGIEFPGGKVEKRESPEEAARREVMEETGGCVSQLTYIGQYYVHGKGGNIAKNVYYATVSTLTKQSNYYETEGPVLLNKLPENIETDQDFSFMMKDNVLPLSLEQIEKYRKVNQQNE